MANENLETNMLIYVEGAQKKATIRPGEMVYVTLRYGAKPVDVAIKIDTVSLEKKAHEKYFTVCMSTHTPKPCEKTSDKFLNNLFYL